MFATQLGLYTISNAHLFPNDHRKLILAFFYLTGAEISWPQPTTRKMFEDTCINYTQFTPNCEAVCFERHKEESHPSTEADQINGHVHTQIQPPLPFHRVGDPPVDQAAHPGVQDGLTLHPDVTSGV